jgi:uncharacterized DUF497 family protein
VPPTIVDGPYEWDDAKARSNERKHSVTFREAATALQHPSCKVFRDNGNPERLKAIGYSFAGRLLTVVHEPRGERERIISAWKSTRAERKRYWRPESEEV